MFSLLSSLLDTKCGHAFKVCDHVCRYLVIYHQKGMVLMHVKIVDA